MQGTFIGDYSRHIDHESGLLQAHSYSIIGISETNEGKFLKIRNFWGHEIKLRNH